MKERGTPRSHVWQLAEPGIWCCPWCKAYALSTESPSPELPTRFILQSLEEAHAVMARTAGPEGDEA